MDTSPDLSSHSGRAVGIFHPGDQFLFADVGGWCCTGWPERSRFGECCRIPFAVRLPTSPAHPSLVALNDCVDSFMSCGFGGSLQSIVATAGAPLWTSEAGLPQVDGTRNTRSLTQKAFGLGLRLGCLSQASAQATSTAARDVQLPQAPTLRSKQNYHVETKYAGAQPVP